MTSNQLELRALQFEYTGKSFEENFQTLSRLLKCCPKDSLTLAPELCLSGYTYEDMQACAQYSKEVLPKLCSLSEDKTFGLTMSTEEPDGFENSFFLFHKGEVIHKRAKARLFKLGDEQKHFHEGDDDKIELIDIGGIKIAVLVCFELRFSELWKKILGAHIVMIPALWGEKRKEHLKTLSEALAVMNQAFVIVSNSSDTDMASSSGIITPFGRVFRDDSSMLIKHTADFSELKKMRRYIQIGLQ